MNRQNWTGWRSEASRINHLFNASGSGMQIRCAKQLGPKSPVACQSNLAADQTISNYIKTIMTLFGK